MSAVLGTVRERAFTPFTWSELAQHGPMHPNMGRTVLPYAGLAEVFIDYAEEGQAAHMGRHMFVIVNKYGHAECSTCDARGWSASFVASGTFPIVTESVDGKARVVSDTSTYIHDTLANRRMALGRWES